MRPEYRSGQGYAQGDDTMPSLGGGIDARGGPELLEP
jgi:hypothetical protein